MGTFKVNHGHWIWDDHVNKLAFISHEIVQKQGGSVKSASGVDKSAVGCTHADLNITFSDTVDLTEKIRFRQHYQRSVRANEADVITIRDIKDVVLFQTESSLAPEFLDFVHTRGVDRLLRALIVYFQMYIQTFELLLQRRSEADKKLRHPHVLVVEEKFRSDLAILRAMVGHKYSCLLLGAGKMHRFHHMANKQHTSSGEKDTRIYELLYRVSVRVVWIALNRRYGNLIEDELNRLFRTDAFNMMKRLRQERATIAISPLEKTILRGLFDEEPKLYGHSPAITQLLDEHDYRLLGMDHIDFNSNDPRVKYFEILFDCPEEKLKELGVSMGILGLSRGVFDAMLVEQSRGAALLESNALAETASLLQTQLEEQEEAPDETEFKLPDYGMEEPVPIFFPRITNSSPDLHFQNREDAKRIWKNDKSHHKI